MKQTALIFVLIISLNCLSQNSKNQNNQNLNISFTEFISKFVQLKLPLEINRLNDLGKYSDKIVKVVKGKNVLKTNPLCPTIPKDEYKFISDKFPTNKNFYYQSVYVKDYKNYVLLVIIQNNRITGDYFLKLNVYNLSGKIIDTLSLAGQKIDKTDRFCSIDTNLKIKIRILNFYPDNQNGELNGLEIKEEYLIADDGHFKRTYYKKEEGLFLIKDDEEIRVDKKK